MRSDKLMKYLLLFLLHFSALISHSLLANSYFHPKLSPSGKQLAFYGYVGKQPDIFIFNLETNEIKQITTTSDNWEIEPKWIDEKTLAISSGANMRKIRLTKLDVATGQQTMMTGHVEIEGFVAKEPNTKRMYVNWNKNGSFNLYKMNMDGSDPIALTNFEKIFIQQIFLDEEQALASYKDDAVIISLSGKIKKNLTQSDEKITHPQLSPNKEYLIYVSDKNGKSDLYLKHLTSGKVERLTHDEHPEYAPVFSLDGKSIYYSGVKDNALNILHMNIADKSVKILTAKL